MATIDVEKGLRVALAALQALAPGLLEKAQYLLDKSAPSVVCELLAQMMDSLADPAKVLVVTAHEFAERSDSKLGKEVAKVATPIANKLRTKAKMLREVSPGRVTYDPERLALNYEIDVKSLKRWIKEVKDKVDEVAGFLKEHAELKAGGPSFIIAYALKVALAVLKSSAPALLAKAGLLLAQLAPRRVRVALAQALEKLGDTAITLENKAIDFARWSGSDVGKEVAAVAKEIADKLYERARKLREESSPSKVEMELATHDLHKLALAYEVDENSLNKLVDNVEEKVQKVTALLKKHVEVFKDGDEEEEVQQVATYLRKKHAEPKDADVEEEVHQVTKAKPKKHAELDDFDVGEVRQVTKAKPKKHAEHDDFDVREVVHQVMEAKPKKHAELDDFDVEDKAHQVTKAKPKKHAELDDFDVEEEGDNTLDEYDI